MSNKIQKKSSPEPKGRTQRRKEGINHGIK